MNSVKIVIGPGTSILACLQIMVNIIFLYCNIGSFIMSQNMFFLYEVKTDL